MHGNKMLLYRDTGCALRKKKESTLGEKIEDGVAETMSYFFATEFRLLGKIQRKRIKRKIRKFFHMR
jgi:hypothetical protein